jgi:hypothetical protein
VLHFDNIFGRFPYRLNGFSDWNREPAAAEGAQQRINRHGLVPALTDAKRPQRRALRP